MIDPLDSLAFSMEANRGVYALLVGSGVSFAAEIPTGEQITSELIRRLAHIKNEDCGSDPKAWYRQIFEEEPDYSILLSQIAKTQNERSNLLKEFFEPSEDEKRRGAKLPTKAHRAIAQLVLKGYVKAIITTNFDNLLEIALREIGISPIVISNRDLAENAFSIIHTKCSIIKVNGDYLDPRIKNTYSELEEYDDATNKRLDQIFDEFGLVVCGWSAEWDVALRRALERCENHGFSTYWVDIKEPGEKAKRLIAHRQASFIQIIDADTFFQGIAERVLAIESFKKPHPISKQIVIARTKKYLVNDSFRIDLHDLLRYETERLCENLLNEYALNNKILCYAELEDRLHILENLTEPVLAMIITGCYWGNKIHSALWIECIERVANISSEIECDEKPWFCQYPAMLLFYGGGIASIANSNCDVLTELLTKPLIMDGTEEQSPVLSLIPEKIIDINEQRRLFGDFKFNKWTPMSNYLFEFLRKPMKEFLQDDNRYQKCFDQFEYLVALQHAYLRGKDGKKPYGPIGCFGWRYRDSDYSKFADNIKRVCISPKEGWQSFVIKLCEGDPTKYLELKKEFDGFVENNAFGWINYR